MHFGLGKLFWEIPKMFLLFWFSVKNNGKVQGLDKRVSGMVAL